MNPLTDTTFRQIPPEDTFRINYDLTRWQNPWTGIVKYPVNLRNEDVRWLFLHHGGGRNPAGELVIDPELTPLQRMLVNLGLARTVLRSWEQYHVQTKGWMGIAYDLAVTQYGQVFRLRGWRVNAGQWGSTPNRWNATSLAVVWVGGEGQHMSRRAWRALARIWLEASFGLPKGRALSLQGHRYTNFDTPPQYQTSCPGNERMAQIADNQHLKALGVLRVRTIPVRRAQIRSLTRGLMILGLLDRTWGKYTKQVAAAVRAFQFDNGLEVDGVCGPLTWQRLAEQVSLP